MPTFTLKWSFGNTKLKKNDAVAGKSRKRSGPKNQAKGDSMYRLRLSTGPCSVDRIADILAKRFDVEMRGTSHIYVLLRGYANSLRHDDVKRLFIAICREHLGTSFGWSYADINVQSLGSI